MTNTAEKVETIVLCYLQHRTTSGTFGELVDVASDPALGLAQCYRVYMAAKLALDGRQGRDVGTVAQALGWSC